MDTNIDANLLLRFYRLDLTPNEIIMVKSILAERRFEDAVRSMKQAHIDLADAGLSNGIKIGELMSSINKKLKEV